MEYRTGIMDSQAKVYLVGAGPGDPDLLTVKALSLICAADVVVYDRLVSPEILALIPPGVARIAVGKLPGHHCVPQREINGLLVGLAARKRVVVRLKGGDPFVFGRGSEEALELTRHGIPYEVVPGVTAASAVSAYAGVPLTHRGISRAVHLVTGHLRDDEPLDLDWRRLADPNATLVVYMGLTSLETITARLMEAGLASTTPAAAVQEGCTPRQRTVRATLETLAPAVRTARLQSPVAVIIGRTVDLADQLAWFFSPAEAASDVTSRLAGA
jgi:uroporphyrin-III C-methyltransferase/precorrin-2 dehydrogenase/sirohydrochlorin ferrochelatase/uroporphyrin-III C-methyltransferase